jgi:hypothetical protein
MAGNVKIAEDRYQNKMQFAHLKCDTAKTITTATQFDTTSDRHVVITPVSSDAYVTIDDAATTPSGTGNGNSLGKLITFGSSYTTIVRAGEYIGATAAVNCVALGEL